MLLSLARGGAPYASQGDRSFFLSDNYKSCRSKDPLLDRLLDLDKTTKTVIMKLSTIAILNTFPQTHIG